MKSETVKIILPLPPRVLSPNCPAGTRGGRFARAAATKKYKRLAKEAAEAAMIETAPWSLASVGAVFFFKDGRRRDQDNAVASIKAAYDGLVTAGLVVDDDYAHLERKMPTFEVDAKCPRVELVLERKEPV